MKPFMVVHPSLAESIKNLKDSKGNLLYPYLQENRPMDTACPKCGETIHIISTKIVGNNIVVTGECQTDGIVEVVD